MALSIGDSFGSFVLLENAIKAFEKENLANFYIRSSKQLKATREVTEADVNNFKSLSLLNKAKFLLSMN